MSFQVMMIDARRSRSAPRALRPSLWIAVVVLSVAGCQATHRQAKEQATQRWNTVRAQVKTRLASDQLVAGNVADAANELAQAYNLDPTIPELVPLQARVHLAGGEIHEAQRLLENVAVPGATRAEVEYLLGIVWQHRQCWDAAQEHFTRASLADPDEVAYFVAVVQAMLQSGAAAEALEWLHSGQETFGWTGAYQAAWAECQEQLGDWDAAAAAWSKVVGTSGADAGVRERLATALYRAGRLSEATPIFLELIEDDTVADAAYLRLALADCLLEDGRVEAASRHIAGVLRQDERNAVAWRLMARTLAAQQRYEAALRAARRAVAVNADDPQSLELAAALAHRYGDQESAAALATRLLDRDTDCENQVARLILEAAAAPGQSDPQQAGRH